MLTNKQHLAAFFAEALPFIDKTTPTDINSGGCGTFANLFTDKLDEFGIEYKIVGVCMYDVDSSFYEGRVRNFKEFVNNNKKDAYNTGIDHVVVKIDELFYDSTGIVNTEIFLAKELFYLTKHQLKQVVEEAIWNDVFDRDLVPSIKEKMDKHFTEENISNYSFGMFHLNTLEDLVYTPKTIRAKRKQSGRSMLEELFSR